ncbi:MAG: DEAD/DEAH box helicase family protein [Pseudomonadota bacterium]
MTYIKRIASNVDLKSLIDDELLIRFLETTQKDELNELKIDLGKDWLSIFKEKIAKQLETKKIFELLRNGVEVRGRHFRLVYFKPETSYNPEQMRNYQSNIFSYVRQFAFHGTMESIDVVLFLNGFPIITIELKNQFNGQIVDDAVHQYAQRDKKGPIFNVPFLHLACDLEEAKIATQFIQNSASDFVHFNTDIQNPTKENEFAVDYLYHDVLRPESLLEIVEAYLFCFEEKDETGKKYRRFLFPRYHQRRTVINLMGDLTAHFRKKQQLGKRYLIQHSPGSGKSYTIAVMQKFLRNAHVENRHLFNSLIVVTDRINLDGQIKGTIGPSEPQPGIIAHAETTTELAKALNENTKVIITTIQKFSVKKLDELLTTQKGKKICFIIDEAHRSQAGKLHKHMVEKFDEEIDPQEELLQGISKKSYPNAIFIALTATPSDKTLEMFGRPFDVYTMDQAEQEGYILNVVENVVTYSTLFKMSREVSGEDEYPPMVVAKKLKAKAFEDDSVIAEKIDILLRVFEAQSTFKIGGMAKVMIVTSSRKSAAKYKLKLDAVLKERKLPYKTLVAFSGSVKLAGREDSFTEINMNKIDEEIEDQFNTPEYRFIIVANKYQYGFNQPYLHTMFLDKAVSGINAVQTISRLNRVLVGKTDTLVVDFTDSYEAIIAAFRKFKKEVNDYSGVDVRDLPRLQNELLGQGVFTKADVEDFERAIFHSDQATSAASVMLRVMKNVEKMQIAELRAFRSQLNRFNDTFKYMDNLFRISDKEMRNFYLFTNYLAKYIDPIGKGGKLDEELKKVYMVSHKIRLEKRETKPETQKVPVAKAKRTMQYATIDEVIEAINANYDIALGDNDKNLLKQYMESIVEDPEIIASVQANKSHDLWRLYATSLSSQLKEKAIQFFLTNNPAKLVEYLDEDLFTYLNQEAFRLATKQIVTDT